ncbi:MAG: bile acid:sodium symporter family protein [Myxococcota bacterium]
MTLDQVTLELDPNAQLVLAVLLALIMFSVALGLTTDDFRRVLRRPGLVLYGLAMQLIGLPAVTFALAWFIAPSPSIALGMIVVAACPGGSVSNFFTLNARGDTALSVSLTAVSSVASAITTPLNVVFWASLNPDTLRVLAEVGLDRTAFIVQTTLILAVPLAIGMIVAARLPGLTAVIRRPCRLLAFAALSVFIVGAVAANWSHLIGFGLIVVPVVIAHNTIALSLGYGAARIFALPESIRRAFTFEIGIQNAGLGLVILLDHFKGLGGAAMITALWGVWHFISGLALVSLWSRRPPRQ